MQRNKEGGSEISPMRTAIPVEASRVGEIKDQWNKLKGKCLIYGLLTYADEDYNIAKYLHDHLREFHEMLERLTAAFCIREILRTRRERRRDPSCNWLRS